MNNLTSPKLAKRLYFFVVITLFLTILPSVNAFSWQANFYNYMNFSSISNTATFNNVNIGSVNYAYLDLSSIGNSLGYVWLQGYNAGNFIGNVSAYPYKQGLLISLKTTTGRTYNTLTLFFNQVSPINTYYYNNYTTNPPTTNYKPETYLTIYEIGSFYGLYVYLTPSFNQSTSCPLNDITNTITCSYSFKPNQAYYVYATNTYAYQNISLDYIVPSGWRDLELYGSNTMLSIESKSALGVYINLDQASTMPYFTIVNSSLYNLLSYSLGAYSNAIIFNSMESSTSILAIPLTNNKATLSITVPQIYNSLPSFVVIPAYTTSYSNSIVYLNTTPNSPTINNTVCNYQVGWYCFKYREFIYGINWSFNYTTYAEPSSLGIAYHVIVGPNGVPYLMLNITHYAEMNNTCTNVYMDAYNSSTNIDYGPIPFYVYNCTSNGNHPASFILANKTAYPYDYAYNNFYVYYDKLNGVPFGFSNKTILADWQFATGNNLIISDSPILIKLSYSLNTGSYIRYGDSSNTMGIQETKLGYVYPYDNISTTYAYGGGKRILKDASGYPFLNILQYGKSLITKDLIGNITNLGGANPFITIISNTSTSQNVLQLGNTGNPFITTIYIPYSSSINNATLYKLWTTQFNIGSTEENPASIIIPNSSLHKTVIVPNSNSSLIRNSSNSSLIGNQPYFISLYGYIINFYGISIPAYYLMIIGILLIIFICIFIASGNIFLVIIGLLCLWASGILLAISSNLSLTVVALIITLVYIVHNAPKWFKKW